MMSTFTYWWFSIVVPLVLCVVVDSWGAFFLTIERNVDNRALITLSRRKLRGSEALAMACAKLALFVVSMGFAVLMAYANWPETVEHFLPLLEGQLVLAAMFSLLMLAFALFFYATALLLALNHGRRAGAVAVAALNILKLLAIALAQIVWAIVSCLTEVGQMLLGGLLRTATALVSCLAKAAHPLWGGSVRLMKTLATYGKQCVEICGRLVRSATETGCDVTSAAKRPERLPNIERESRDVFVVYDYREIEAPIWTDLELEDSDLDQDWERIAEMVI